MGSNPNTPLLLADASSTGQPASVPLVDWDNLQIVESHDEKGRIELMRED